MTTVRPADQSADRSAERSADRRAGTRDERSAGRRPAPTPDDAPAASTSTGSWDDGLIARRARPDRPPRAGSAGSAPEARNAPPPRPETLPRPPAVPAPHPGAAVLRPRLDALRELVGLSRARLDRRTLAEAGRVLDEAVARQRHPLDLTVVAIAGASGSGKSTLFNALARAQLSEAGVRRPTTAAPVACVWTEEPERADGVLDRLGIPARSRRQPVRPYDPALNGLVLLDLPDHDSASPGHREQVDRLLGLVDAVIWVVDPEKYADAVLHERYLRPLAGYAEVSFIVLNQVDRLGTDAADQVLDDLRRLLDDDGIALGEHGEPGAEVLALSALTGDGVGELRESLGKFTASRGAALRRLTADVDGVSARLRGAYVADGRPGLTESARHEFEDRLAEAVGAQAAGLAAERAWLRDAGRACGTPWTRARQWCVRGRAARKTGGAVAAGAAGASTSAGTSGSTRSTGADPKAAAEAKTGAAVPAPASPFPSAPLPAAAGAGTDADGPAAPPARAVSRPLVEQAVRALAYEASAGLPDPWALAVREAARRGAEGLAEALDAASAAAAAAMAGAGAPGRPGMWRTGARRASAWCTGVDRPAAPPATGGDSSGRTGWRTGGRLVAGRRARGGGAARQVRPGWWAVAAAVQWVLSALQAVAAAWLLGVLTSGWGGDWWIPGLLLAGGGAGAPALAWCSRAMARGPARRYGLETERRLRNAAAGCGRERVLEPVAAELLRYQEVRTQYVIAAGEA
ncbi:ATP-binding protein [Streptomyces rectiverticillatus]|uniref:GTPase n=1 Tax=Streptomyces rectiverticillatus TaxID=173860 RepID=UPI001FE3B33F|nr:GTPase [Streptomyces rectiverticillatus]QLE72113.1 ATP-binding protein [Streptomyces rectiverticillatus]